MISEILILLLGLAVVVGFACAAALLAGYGLCRATPPPATRDDSARRMLQAEADRRRKARHRAEDRTAHAWTFHAESLIFTCHGCHKSVSLEAVEASSQEPDRLRGALRGALRGYCPAWPFHDETEATK